MKPRTVVAALLLLTAVGHSQPARETWESLNTLAAGAEVRVSLTGGKTVRGFFQKASPDAIVVSAAKSEEMLARQDVRRVQIKKPGHRGRNALIGLGVGAGGGLATGAVFDSKTGDDFLISGFGKIAFTAFGAVVGTVIGVAWPTGGWRDVYRAR